MYAIQPNENWVISFAPKLITYNAGAAGSLFSATDIITANKTINSSEWGKAFVCASATSTLDITLPDLGTIPENKPTIFFCQGSNNPNTSFLCQGNDTIIYLSSILKKLVLAPSESLWLYKWSGTYYVLNDLTGVMSVGQIINSYKTDFYNTVFANGSLLDRDVYPRLWDFVQSLDASMLVSDSNWTNLALKNTGKFSTGDGSTTFRVPLLYAPGFLRGVDGVTRKASDYEAEMIGPHNHPFGYDILVGGNSHPTTLRADSNAGSSIPGGSTQNNSGTENRPANTGIYLSIRI